MGGALELPVNMLGHEANARNKVTVRVSRGATTIGNHEFDPLLCSAFLEALQDYYGPGQLYDSSSTPVTGPRHIQCGHYEYQVQDDNAQQQQQQQQLPQMDGLSVSTANNAMANGWGTHPSENIDRTATHGVRLKAESGSYVLQRTAVLSDITNLLSTNGCVLLRAGPGTGKTSILESLVMEVEEQEEGSGQFEHVTYFSCASVQQGKEDSVTAFKRCTNKDWSFIANGVIQEGVLNQGVHLICIDDFHLSYENSHTTYHALYEKIKNAMHVNNNAPPAYRIIAAATYGGTCPFHAVINNNPSNFKGCTPLYLTHLPVICAEPTADKDDDNSRTGLLLSEVECDQLWDAFLAAPCHGRFQLQLQFQDPETKRKIFQLSAGHVGAVCLILEELIRRLQTSAVQGGNGDEVARQLLSTNAICQAVSTGIANGTVRGFMSHVVDDLHRQIINIILRQGKLQVFYGEQAGLTPAALRMVRHGYVHMNDEGEVSLPSPLHEQWYRQLIGAAAENNNHDGMDISTC